MGKTRRGMGTNCDQRVWQDQQSTAHKPILSRGDFTLGNSIRAVDGSGHDTPIAGVRVCGVATLYRVVEISVRGYN